MLIHWALDPVLVQVGPVAVRWYGLLFVGAFLLGRWMLARVFEQRGLPPAHADRLLLYALIGAVLGARLVHCLFYEPAFYLRHPLEILKTWEGGLASHGGVLGLLAGLALGIRRLVPQPALLEVTDCTALPAAVGAALIRIANFLNSEIVGVPTGREWGVVFTAVDALPRHPVQLYEAAAYLLIAAGLAALQRNGGLHRRGLLTGCLLLAVFTARIGLEVFKTSQAAHDAGWWLSVGQLLSVPLVIAGAVLVRRAMGLPAEREPRRPCCS